MMNFLNIMMSLCYLYKKILQNKINKHSSILDNLV